MSSYIFGAKTFSKSERHTFNKLPRVDEDECRSVGFRISGKLVKDLFPHTVRGYRAELVTRHLDRNIHRALFPYLDDRRLYAIRTGPNQERSHQFDRILRC